MKPHSLPKATIGKLSERLKNEQEAYRYYRYVSNCLRNKGMLIAAAYFEKEAQEELEHAHKLEKYATDWNTELDFMPLPVPSSKETLEAIIEESYKMEYALLGHYEDDCVEALNKGDISTFTFLQEYVNIQREAVAGYADMLNMLDLFDKSDKNWIFNFEKKLFK